MRAPWDHITADDYAAAKDVYTMLSVPEQQMLCHFGREVKGAGAVVDLGAFLGGSASRLAAGLAQAKAQPSLHSYDRFQFSQETRDANLPPELRDLDGDEIVRRLVTPIYAHYQTHMGHFPQMQWSGGSVEILFVDLAKSIEALDHATREFYPHMVAGPGVLIQQDLNFYKTPWIAAHMEIWADKFEYIGNTPRSSVAYRLIKPISQTEANERLMEQLSDQDILTLLDMARKNGEARGYGALFERWDAMIGTLGLWRSTRNLRFRQRQKTTATPQ